MKFLIALLLVSSVSFASVPKEKEYSFLYRMTVKGRVQKFQCFGKDPYDKAFRECADKCFDHFKSMGYPMTEERGLAIIDTCANPNSNQEAWY
jgi:hypothetical protein